MTIALIECNRLQAVNSNTTNDENFAQWSNKVGDGIKLQPGDSVSVHSAYINEVGVGADVVHITGKVAGTTTFKVTDIETGLDVDTEIISSDNKVTIQINFYKCADGENMLTLPRNCMVDNYDCGALKLIETMNDELKSWRGFMFASSAISVGPNAPAVPLVPTGNPPVNTARQDTDFVAACVYRRKYDASRYTVMVRDLTQPLVDITSADWVSIPLRNYTVFKQAVEIDVPKGYITAESLAKHASDAFISPFHNTLPSLPSYIWTNTGAGTYPAFVPPQPQPNLPQTFCFREFSCANMATFSRSALDGYTAFTSSAAHTNTVYTDALKNEYFAKLYLHNFDNICVFAPELMEAGKAFAKNMHADIVENAYPVSQILSTFVKGTSSYVETEWAYDSDNLETLNALLTAQNDHGSISERYLAEIARIYNCDNLAFLHCHSTASPIVSPSVEAFGSDTVALDMTTAFFFDSASIIKYYNTNDEKYYIALKLVDQPAGELEMYPDTVARLAGEFVIGWDQHWSAYGTDVCLLTNGMMQGSVEGYRGFGDPGSETDEHFSLRYMRSGAAGEDLSCTSRILLGAETPSITFNTVSERYEINMLHTPRRLRSGCLAGYTATSGVPSPPEFQTEVNPQANDPIFEYAPPWFNAVYNPEAFGTDLYNLPFGVIGNVEVYSNVNDSEVVIRKPTPIANLIDQEALFDTSTGVFITDFGVKEADWEESMWGRMGFVYDQMIRSGYNRFDRNARIYPTNPYMYPLTTNAAIDDALVINTNAYNIPNYTLGTRVPSLVSLRAPTTGTLADFSRSLQRGTTLATGVSVPGGARPLKITIPYYTIQSNIILNKNYFGAGGQKAGVVAIVSKAYTGDDYYFLMTDETVSFTVDMACTLTDVQTSIHNPDGSFAVVDKACAVIYRVQRAAVVAPPLYMPPPPIKKKKKARAPAPPAAPPAGGASSGA